MLTAIKNLVSPVSISVIDPSNDVEILQSFALLKENVESFPHAYADYVSLEPNAQVARYLSYIKSPFFLGVMAVHKGEPIGYVLGDMQGDRIHMWSVYIKPEHYGQDTLIKLLNEYKRLADELGYSEWTCHPDPETYYKFLGPYLTGRGFSHSLIIKGSV